MPLRQAEGALRVSCGRMADGQRERVRYLIASVLVLSRAMRTERRRRAFVNETRAVKKSTLAFPTTHHSRSPCFVLDAFVRWNFLPTDLFAA